MMDMRVMFPGPCDKKWEGMAEQGCHRFCESCDKIVHDLSQYTISDVERLMSDDPEICVRASIDASGLVATKAERRSAIRRMVAIMGASAGLLMSPPAFANGQRNIGAIVGKTETHGFKTTVTAKGEDGRSYKAKVRSNGRYKIRNVPPGTYRVEFASDCGPNWAVENVVVGGGKVDVSGEPDPNDRCIIVGQLKIHDSHS